MAIHPLDVRHSRTRWTVEEGGVRVGLRAVRGLGDAAARRIEDVMHGPRPARTAGELYGRAGLAPAEATALARSGALRGLEPERRRALWRAPTLAAAAGQGWLPGLAEGSVQEVALPALTPAEETRLDYRTLGFSPDRHVLALVRPDLVGHGLATSATLGRIPPGQRVAVVGQMVTQQRPMTARGMLFLSLSDEWGMINAVVTPAVAAAYRSVLRGEALVWLTGTLTWRQRVPMVQVTRLAPLAACWRAARATDGPIARPMHARQQPGPADEGY